MTRIVSFGLMIAVVALTGAAAQEAELPALDTEEAPGRIGDNSMQVCLRDPMSCDASREEAPDTPVTRGKAQPDPDAKLQHFKQQFKCGESASGICVEDAN